MKEEKKKKNFIETFLSFSKGIKAIIGSIVALLLAVVICVIIFAPNGRLTVSVTTALKEVMESAEMSTAEFVYNSIATMPIDATKAIDEKNIKYYVAYKGTVKSGFDFSKIEVIEKNNSIVVIIPKIEIQSVNVGADLTPIFLKDKYETEKIYAEAYNLCCDDLMEKAASNTTLYTSAIESAVETIEALVKPFQKQLNEGETIKVVYTESYNSAEVE